MSMVQYAISERCALDEAFSFTNVSVDNDDELEKC